MWQFRIKPVDLGFILKKFKEENDSKITLYWNGKRRDNREECAKIYYFEDEAISGLIIARKFGGNESC